MYKILITRYVPEEFIDPALREKVEFVFPPTPDTLWTEKDWAEYGKDCDALLTVLTKATKEMMAANPQFKVIGTVSVGYDHIDVAGATELGRPVVNTPNAVTHATAELTIAMMLDMVRQTRKNETQARTDLFCKHGFMTTGMHTLEGKTLGIIGFGRIGQDVARKARAFDMDIVYNQRHQLDAQLEAKYDAKYLGLEELLKTSDVVCLNCPLTPETRGLINEERIALMKDGSYIVNMARGPVVCEDAVVAALKSGKLAGAAFDVHEFEPKINPELAKMDNVSIQPHVGTGTEETRKNIFSEVVTGIIACLDGEVPYNRVNK